MKKLALPVLFALCLAGAAAAQSMDDPPSDFEPNEGIVRSIDKVAGELVIRHGPLPVLSMPPMTMAFEVSARDMLDTVKPGDRVTFRVDLLNGRFTVTRIERKRQEGP